jgi:hypothetical protein
LLTYVTRWQGEHGLGLFKASVNKQPRSKNRFQNPNLSHSEIAVKKLSSQIESSLLELDLRIG